MKQGLPKVKERERECRRVDLSIRGLPTGKRSRRVSINVHRASGWLEKRDNGLFHGYTPDVPGIRTI